MYQIVATDGRAKSAHMETVHCVIETPVFMNVGTIAAIKGAVATTDLKEIGTQWNYPIPIIFMFVRETRL